MSNTGLKSVSRTNKRMNKKIQEESHVICTKLSRDFFNECKDEDIALTDDRMPEVFEKYNKKWRRWVSTKISKDSADKTQANDLLQQYVIQFISSATNPETVK